MLAFLPASLLPNGSSPPPPRPSLRCSLNAPTLIALTRESGKNNKLATAARLSLPTACTIELPCVQTVHTTNLPHLPTALQEPYTWVLISSPESARLVANTTITPTASIAAIGAGTASVLRAAGLTVSFEPTRATFNCLAAELPAQQGARLLYPASAKASAANVALLHARGFEVTRLDTYTTATAPWTDAQRKVSDNVQIVTFASPTTVRGWAANASPRRDFPAACIGETSANAARKAGFEHVFFPQSPGIKGWVSAIQDAATCVRV